jgi:hypothetical protein
LVSAFRDIKLEERKEKQGWKKRRKTCFLGLQLPACS